MGLLLTTVASDNLVGEEEAEAVSRELSCWAIDSADLLHLSLGSPVGEAGGVHWLYSCTSVDSARSVDSMASMDTMSVYADPNTSVDSAVEQESIER